jgi:cell division protein FtsZ
LVKLKPHLNALSILPNGRVFEVVPKATAFSKTLSYVNTMLSDSLEGLVETIYDTGVINIDFADLRAILSGNGKMAFLNTVIFKKGEEANQDSFEKVFGSPLYPYTIDKARGLLLNIVAQKDLKLLEVNKILTSVSGRIHKDARIIFGVAHEGAGINTVKVTVLATGCVYDGFGGGHDSEKEILPPVPLRSEAPAKNAGVAKKSKSAKKTNKPAAHLILPKPPRKINSAKNKKNNSKSSDGKSSAVKKEIVVKVKNSPIEIEAEKRPRTVPGADINDALTNELNAIETRRNIAAQFEMPVRKNALQVKKEIEMEEKEMLEKEKAWEVPAFLRKQKK